MSEGEEKTYCKPRQVRDQTDGKSDVDKEAQKVKSNDKMAAEMENVQLSENAKIATIDISVLKTSRRNKGHVQNYRKYH